MSTKRDVGSQPGTHWLLSSHKAGQGVPQLRDDSLNFCWMSDGQQPHTISIQFSKRTPVTHVSIYLDYTMDDSYTATKIQIKAGTHYHDLQEVRTREFVEPKGWKSFLLDKADPTSEEEEYTGLSPPQPPIYVNLLQICVLANHLNGKDTHLRGIKVFSPSLPINTSTQDQIDSQIGLNSLLTNSNLKSKGKNRDYKVKLSEKPGVGSKQVHVFDRSKSEESARKKALKSFEKKSIVKDKERDLIIKREDGTRAIRTSDSGLDSDLDEDIGDESMDEDLNLGRQGERDGRGDDDFRKFIGLLPELSRGFGSGGLR